MTEALRRSLETAPGFTCKGRLRMTGREAAAPRALWDLPSVL